MGRTETSERYSRQVVLKELGESGQQKLKQVRVLVIGAGGLGCRYMINDACVILNKILVYGAISRYEEFDKMLNEKEFMIIDVREQGELPLISEFEYTALKAES